MTQLIFENYYFGCYRESAAGEKGSRQRLLRRMRQPELGCVAAKIVVSGQRGCSLQVEHKLMGSADGTEGK